MAIPPTPGDPRLSLRPAPSGGEHDAPSPRLGGQGVACLWCGLTSSGGGSVSVLCMSPREQNAPMPHWQGQACWRRKDSPPFPLVCAIAPCVPHGRLACLGSRFLAQKKCF